MQINYPKIKKARRQKKRWKRRRILKYRWRRKFWRRRKVTRFRNAQSHNFNIILNHNAYAVSSYFIWFLKYFGLFNSSVSSAELIKFLSNMLFQQYLGSFFKLPLNLYTYNISKFAQSALILKYKKPLIRVTPRILNFIYFEDIIELFYVVFRTKEVLFLKRWIKRQFEVQPFSNHRNLQSVISQFLVFFGIRLKDHFGIVGYSLALRGKINKGGVRKKTFKTHHGTNSFTSKSTRMAYSSFYLRTISGSISCKLKLFY